jgi:hypothetical protein
LRRPGVARAKTARPERPRPALNSGGYSWSPGTARACRG